MFIDLSSDGCQKIKINTLHFVFKTEDSPTVVVWSPYSGKLLQTNSSARSKCVCNSFLRSLILLKNYKNRLHVVQLNVHQNVYSGRKASQMFKSPPPPNITTHIIYDGDSFYNKMLVFIFTSRTLKQTCWIERNVCLSIVDHYLQAKYLNVSCLQWLGLNHKEHVYE